MVFAIYDSPAGSQQLLSDALCRLSDAEILCFNDASALCAHPSVDLLFLPLEHIPICEPLGSQTNIVLIGEPDALSPDSLCCRPIGFLTPGADDASVAAVIERFRFYHDHLNRVYTLQTRDNSQKIPHETISYFHSSGHYAILHTDSGESFQHLRKLDDIESELSALPYLRCHQRYLVHLPHVDRLDHQQMRLILRSGESVPVSKRLFGHVVNDILARNQI